jgi:hypothetical protein
MKTLTCTFTVAILAMPALADDLWVSGVDEDLNSAVYLTNEIAVEGANQSGHCISQWANADSCQQHEETGLWKCKAAIAGSKPEKKCDDHDEMLEKYKINLM